MRDIDPDGREKLRRDVNDKTARSLLRTLIVARRLIIQSLRNADAMRSADPRLAQWRQIEATIMKWKDEAETSQKELSDILVELRVVWGQPAVVNEVAYMTVYLDRCRRMSTFKFLDLSGISYPSQPEPKAEQETWSWKMVFDGNERHSKMLTDAIDEIVERAERAVAEFIASRGQN